MRTAVIMAGGGGTRLRPLTERIPKPMVLLDHRPVMEFVVAALRAGGVKRIVAVLQKLPGAIVEHFGDGSRFGVAIDYLLQEGEAGTAGSVRQAMDLFDDEDFLVASSDILFHGDLAGGQDLHHRLRSAVTVALARVEDPTGFGVAGMDARGRIRSFQEKPSLETLAQGEGGGDPAAEGEGTWVNAGLYFLSRSSLAEVHPTRPCDFGRDLLPRLLREGAPLHGWRLPGHWRDIGTWSSLEAARREVGELPAYQRLVTRWPADRGGEGGRIYTRQGSGELGWTVMRQDALGQAAEIIWDRLSHGSSEEGKRQAGATLTEIEGVSGMGHGETLAALDWLAREGKVRLEREGRAVRVEPISAG